MFQIILKLVIRSKMVLNRATKENFAEGSGLLLSYPVIFMADPALDLILENSDPLGTYILKATVTDLTNDKNTIGSYTIDLVNGL